MNHLKSSVNGLHHPFEQTTTVCDIAEPLVSKEFHERTTNY
jgi:hypothetical protein